jgi:aspartate kinase
MGVVVHKYGGSSVATPERLAHVADRVVAARAAGDQPVVVVSAMGRTTDALVALAAEVSSGSHRREMDMILTAGERVSMALLAMAIRDRGCDAISLTGSQAGIITTTDHNRARIIEVRPVRVFEALAKGSIVIVGGFAGVSTDKEVTTLGRGGSDTTAIALAGALQADSCDIFSDVEGVFTADPRIVPDARPIDTLDHGEILEMGLRGARVLAPEAIDYARRHGITLHARSSFTQGRGTVITSSPRPGIGRATAISSDRQIVAVWFRGSPADVDRFLRGLAAAGLERKDLRVDEVDGVARGSLLLDTRNSPDAARVAREAGADLDDLEVDESLGTATVVGAGLAEQEGCWTLAREALGRLGITARSLTGSPWGLTGLLPRVRLDEVVRAWHAAFPGLR